MITVPRHFLGHAAALLAGLTLVAKPATAEVQLQFVMVGDPGNAAGGGYGAVAQSFPIMKYEMTNAQYAGFLNAVAASDPYQLYSLSMGSDARGGITRSGTSGGYTYAVKPNMGDKPVNYVTWFDAARMANWLQNGQGSASTETGAYTLNGQISGTQAPAKNPGATVYIPTENQWYKAAYYKGGSTNAGYWSYPTRSNTSPAMVTADLIGNGSASGTGNFANFNNGASWNSLTGNVTTVGSNGGSSAYGTFDMGGNLQEWNDLDETPGYYRGRRGGSFDVPYPNMESGVAGTNIAWGEANNLGFRLVPEPMTGILGVGGFAYAAWTAGRRHRHRRFGGKRPFLSGINTAWTMRLRG